MNLLSKELLNKWINEQTQTAAWELSEYVALMNSTYCTHQATRRTGAPAHTPITARYDVMNCPCGGGGRLRSPAPPLPEPLAVYGGHNV